MTSITADAPPPTLSSLVGDSEQCRVGKIGRIKSLPCFFLRSGGGLTTASFNGIEFGGHLVYVPALDKERFKGGGIMAIRSVHTDKKRRGAFYRGAGKGPAGSGLSLGVAGVENGGRKDATFLPAAMVT